MKRSELNPSTKAIHARDAHPRRNQGVAPAIHLSATFEAKDVDEQVALEENKADTFYTRYGNPTLTSAESVIAELEATDSAAVFSSGMAAITTSLLSQLGAGDHAVFQREVYGGVHRFASEILPRYGVEVSWFSAHDVDGCARAVQDNTKTIYIESPTNPTLKLVDIAAVTKLARSRTPAITTLIDSTFATPLNCRPHELGVDLVLHSATKYLGGHSDLLAGAVAGAAEHIDRVKSYARVLGGTLDPHAAYLLIRGMKSIGVRMERHNQNGVAISEFLAGHERVSQVHYPLMPSHPQVELARRQMKGGGGVLSFELTGGLDAAKRFSSALTLVRVAPSLGGVESLLSIPCLTSHAMLSPSEREQAGIGDGLVRLALGIEEPADLIADLEHALSVL